MTQILLVLLGFVIGIVAGALGYHFWGDIAEKAQEAREVIAGQDPEDVQRRVNTAGTIARKYVLLFVLGLLVVCIVGTVVVANIQPRRVQLGSFISLVDKCGTAQNVQIERAHVEQGFILVSPGTECELRYPLTAPSK